MHFYDSKSITHTFVLHVYTFYDSAVVTYRIFKEIKKMMMEPVEEEAWQRGQ